MPQRPEFPNDNPDDGRRSADGPGERTPGGGGSTGRGSTGDGSTSGGPTGDGPTESGPTGGAAADGAATGGAAAAWNGDERDFPAPPGIGFIPLSCHDGCPCPLHTMTSGRGHFPADDSPDTVNNFEMAQQFSGAINATRVIVNRGGELGALSNTVIQRYHDACLELGKLRARAAGRPITTARRDFEALNRAHATIPPDERLTSHPVLQVFVWLTIAAIAAIESWFLYQVGLEILLVEYGALSGMLGWLLGPILAFLLYATGRHLAKQLMRLRTTRHLREPAPGNANAPDPLYRRVGRALSGYFARRPGLAPLVGGLLALTWLGLLFVWLAYYRAVGQLQVPPIVVMALLGTFAIGAVFLEAMVHNPYAVAHRRLRNAHAAAVRTFEEQCEVVIDRISRLRQAHSALRARRDELLGIARIEVVRSWQCANLPARFLHGQAAPQAPTTARPTDVLPERPFPARLSAADVERYFRVFADVDTPVPDLANLWEAGRVLDEYAPERLVDEVDRLIWWLAESAGPDAEGTAPEDIDRDDTTPGTAGSDGTGPDKADT